uniref:ATP-dependent RNA helicase n=1 Tax=Meloidogyne javanica TaxID=6303 RepID=A0A915M1E9_MELJA
MRVLETLFHLTISLAIVFGMRSGRPSTSSFQGNVEAEQPQEGTNIEPRGRPQIRLGMIEIVIGREYPDEDFGTYFNSKLHQNDKEIFDNFYALVYYKPYDCIAKKDLYNHDELENSIKISENNSKNGFTELNRIYALNKAIKSLCEFKNFSAVKHESLLKKFLESKGTWENQGSRNQAFEEEIYHTSSLPVDETYFEMGDSISVDIERCSNNIINDDKELKSFYPKALILLPTRELAQQTYREVLKLAYRTPLVPALVHGGHNNYAPQVAGLKHGCDILVATPLRLIEMMKNSVINLSQSTFSVMDESDRLLVMFSATYTNKVIGLVEEFLRNDHVKLTITRSLPPNLHQLFYWVGETAKYEGLKQMAEVLKFHTIKC